MGLVGDRALHQTVLYRSIVLGRNRRSCLPPYGGPGEGRGAWGPVFSGRNRRRCPPTPHGVRSLRRARNGPAISLSVPGSSRSARSGMAARRPGASGDVVRPPFRSTGRRAASRRKCRPPHRRVPTDLGEAPAPPRVHPWAAPGQGRVRWRHRQTRSHTEGDRARQGEGAPYPRGAIGKIGQGAGGVRDPVRAGTAEGQEEDPTAGSKRTGRRPREGAPGRRVGRLSGAGAIEKGRPHP